MKNIGEILQKKRIELGFSIDAVSSYLKIKPYLIEALETEGKYQFSSEVYYKGYLRQYIKFLQLDIKLDREFSHKNVSRLEINIPPLESFSPNLSTVFAAIIISFFVYGISSGILERSAPDLLTKEISTRNSQLVKLSD